MKKHHYPTDSVIYIKVHTYKSIAERLTDADKDDGTCINKNWKKKCKTILKNTALFYTAPYLKIKIIICIILYL